MEIGTWCTEKWSVLLKRNVIMYVLYSESGHMALQYNHNFAPLD